MYHLPVSLYHVSYYTKSVENIVSLANKGTALTSKIKNIKNLLLASHLIGLPSNLIEELS